MEEKEEQKLELQQELQWVQYRMKMLDLIELKLLQMKEIAEQAKNNKPGLEEVKVLNTKLNNLATQVRALDGESRILKDGKILK